MRVYGKSTLMRKKAANPCDIIRRYGKSPSSGEVARKGTKNTLPKSIFEIDRAAIPLTKEEEKNDLNGEEGTTSQEKKHGRGKGRRESSGGSWS